MTVTKSMLKVRAGRSIALAPIFSAIDAKCIKRSRLAMKYGITRSLLYQYESGRLQMPQELFDWLMNELGLSHNTISQEARDLALRKNKKGA